MSISEEGSLSPLLIGGRQSRLLLLLLRTAPTDCPRIDHMKTAAVVAATGTQGFSVVRALASAGYHVRALTRSPSKVSTLDLLATAGNNVEAVLFDLNDEATIAAAFDGAYVVFAVTVPEDEALMARPDSAGAEYKGLNETEQGVLMAQTAKRVGVGMFVLSTLSDVQGQFPLKYGNIKTYSEKAAVDQTVIRLDLEGFFIRQGFFNDNITKFEWVKLGQDGKLVYVAPHATRAGRTLPMVSVGHDTGAAVALLIENYHRLGLKHQYFNFGDALYSGQDIADALAKACGRQVEFDTPTSFGEPDSDYDRLTRFIYDPDTTYFVEGSFPDATLASLGFTFQDAEGFAREEVLPFLGLSPC